MGIRPVSWIPLALVAAGALILYGYVSANPLPWNGYGHSVFDFAGVQSMPGLGQYLGLTLGNDQLLPRGSFVLVTAGVITKRPNSDLPEGAYFRLTFAGATIAENFGGAFSHSFETREDASGSDRPEFLIRNDNPFRIDVDVRALAIVAPTVWEHYSLYVPLLVLAAGVAVFWAMYSSVRRRSSRA